MSPAILRSFNPFSESPGTWQTSSSISTPFCCSANIFSSLLYISAGCLLSNVLLISVTISHSSLHVVTLNDFACLMHEGSLVMSESLNVMLLWICIPCWSKVGIWTPLLSIRPLPPKPISSVALLFAMFITWLLRSPVGIPNALCKSCACTWMSLEGSVRERLCCDLRFLMEGGSWLARRALPKPTWKNAAK